MSVKNFEKESRNLAQQVIDYALRVGKNYGVTDAKVIINKAENKIITSENIVTGEIDNVKIIIYAGQKALSFSPARFDIDSLKASIDQNLQYALGFVPANPYVGLLEDRFIYKGAHQDLDLFDHTGLTDLEMRAYVDTMTKKILSAGDIKSIRDAAVSSSVDYAYSLATNGVEKSFATTGFSVYASAIAECKGEMQIGYGSSASIHASDLDSADQIAENAITDATAKLGAVTPVTGEATIVLSPDAAKTFFNSVFGALDGGSVFDKATFWKDSLGQQVLNSAITIEDNPLVKRGLASQVIDSAGMKGEPITFVEKGILKQFNVNMQEARMLGIDPIGRNDGPTNIRVIGGTHDVDALLSDIKDGIYIKSFSGGIARVNNGLFSRQANGLQIKNGKITDTKYANFIVGGNLQDMFMRAVIANDTPSSEKTSFATPTTRLDKMKISGS